jgi:Ser/Thr protein kinase RdoA (MazF antagonist)
MSAAADPRQNDLFASKARAASLADAERIAREQFGLRAEATRLSSERDQNFRIRSHDRRDFVLKLTHPLEPRDVTDFQTGAFEHVARADPELPIPRLLPAGDGSPLVYINVIEGEPPQAARLMTFLDGMPLYKAPRSDAQRADLGRTLARLGLALRGYSHPAEGHELLWDIKQGRRLRSLLSHIEDPERRALATRFQDDVEAEALPALPHLRAQVIHNDFQPWNILVGEREPERVTGVIDFGDMVRSPLINDLAVACAYHVHDTPDETEPLAHVAQIVRAYHAVLPIFPEELSLLPVLIACRMVMTVAITSWRARLHPDNAAYILRNAELSWRGLSRLASVPRQKLLDTLHRACNSAATVP